MKPGKKEQKKNRKKKEEKKKNNRRNKNNNGRNRSEGRGGGEEGLSGERSEYRCNTFTLEERLGSAWADWLSLIITYECELRIFDAFASHVVGRGGQIQPIGPQSHFQRRLSWTKQPIHQTGQRGSSRGVGGGG